MGWLLSGLVAPIVVAVSIDIWRRRYRVGPAAAEHALGNMVKGACWSFAALWWLLVVPDPGDVVASWLLFLTFVAMSVCAFRNWRAAYRWLRDVPSDDPSEEDVTSA